MGDSFLGDLEQSRDIIFEQIIERVALLSSYVSNLGNRIHRAQELIEGLTGDQNKATRLFSSSSYPIEESSLINLNTIEFVPYNTSSYTPNNSNNHPVRGEDIDHIESLMPHLFLQIHDITSVLKDKIKSQDPLNEIKSVSSLLVYHTNESRLLTSSRLEPSRKGKSLTSGSSLHDFVRSNKSRVQERNATKSSSGEEAESQLSPLPESISQYQQVDLIESVAYNNFDILNYQDDDMLTEDLPDVLPTLTGVVEDVNPQQRYSGMLASDNLSSSSTDDDLFKQNVNKFSDQVQSTSSQSFRNIPTPPPLPPAGWSQSLDDHRQDINLEKDSYSSSHEQAKSITDDAYNFLDGFEILFKPLDDLPLPEID